MVFRCPTLVLVLTGISIAAPATADVVYEQRSRAQSAVVQFCDLGCLATGGLPPPTLPPPDVSSTDFAPYTHTTTYSPFTPVARSVLSYTLAGDSISIDASATVEGIRYWSSASAAFDVTFSLTSATSFSLESSGTWDHFGYGAMGISLTGEGTSYAREIHREINCCGPAAAFYLFESGVLGPGTYTLRASVWNFVSVEPPTTASSTTRLTFLPTPVPLPATVWLLASGLAVLVARSRRRGQS